MRRPRRATTLIEMLVACVLFFIFITLAGSLIVDMLRCYRQGEILVRPMQAGRDAMSLMVDSFHNAYSVQWPQPNNITLQVYCDEIGHTDRRLQFYWELESRLLYLMDFRDGPAFPTQTKVLLRDVRALTFNHYLNDEIWTVDMTVGMGNSTTPPLHLQSLVFPRGFQGEP